jgi:type IV fimbrial biogenesis protein FimT
LRAPRPPAQLRTGSRPRRVSGFTLVELALAAAIGVLLVTLAFPAFGDWIGAVELGNHARHLAETMTRARTEAVRRGVRVNLCKSPDQLRCAEAGGWERGFLLHVDADRDGQIGDGEALLARDGPAPSGVTVQANRPLDAYVSFTSHGHARLLNGALQMGTFTVCRRGQLARNVVLSAGGRVRLETLAERCP